MITAKLQRLPYLLCSIVFVMLLASCSQEPPAAIDPELQRLAARAEAVEIIRDDYWCAAYLRENRCRCGVRFAVCPGRG